MLILQQQLVGINGWIDTPTLQFLFNMRDNKIKCFRDGDCLEVNIRKNAMTPDGSDFVDLKVFTKSNGAFDVERYLKYLNYSSLNAYLATPGNSYRRLYEHLVAKKTFAKAFATSFQNSVRAFDIVDVLNATSESFVGFVKKNMSYVYELLENSERYKTVLEYDEIASKLKQLRPSIQKSNLTKTAYQINNIFEMSYLKSLTSLDLKEKFIRKLDESFCYLNNLKKLDLTMNEILGIDKVPFVCFKNLTNLYLSNNDLILISEEAFASMKKLEILKLENNNLAHLEDFMFEGLISLRKLFLKESNIEKLSNETFMPLINLIDLDLSSNRLVSFRSSFSSNNKLEALDLSKNKITELNADFFLNLEHLVVFRASGNQINTIIKGTFDILNKLVNLDLSENYLTQINLYDYKKLNNLQVLNVNKNKVRITPSDALPLIFFTHLKTLKRLHLTNKPILRDDMLFNDY